MNAPAQTPARTLWAPWAWLPEGWQADVLLSVDTLGRWAAVQAGQPCPPGAQRLTAPVLPGLVDAHSHAFQRAMAGLTETLKAAAALLLAPLALPRLLCGLHLEADHWRGGPEVEGAEAIGPARRAVDALGHEAASQDGRPAGLHRRQPAQGRPDATVGLHPGLTVVTGETGAGGAGRRLSGRAATALPARPRRTTSARRR